MDIYKPQISEQLSHNADMAEQWVLAQEREGTGFTGIPDPTRFFQVARDFSNALQRMANTRKRKKTSSGKISIRALVETSSNSGQQY